MSQGKTELPFFAATIFAKKIVEEIDLTDVSPTELETELDSLSEQEENEDANEDVLITRDAEAAQKKEADGAQKAEVAKRLDHAKVCGRTDSAVHNRDRGHKRSRSRRHRRRFASMPPPPLLEADDDSDTEPQRKRLLARAMHSLATAGPGSSIPAFTPRSVGVEVDCLRGCRAKVVPVSAAVAAAMTGGLSPCSSWGLCSGRLLPFQRTANFSLVASCQRNDHRLLVNGGAFFNFLVRQWQSRKSVGSYVQDRKVLYCAFRPTAVGVIGKSATKPLFVKVGFKTFQFQETEHSIINYLEKKTSELRLANIRGAGVFLLMPPASHQSLAHPFKAAEESLKMYLLNGGCDAELRTTPSGHKCDIGTFSASLEYLFVDARRLDLSPLQALTMALRGFSGDPALAPMRAFARTVREDHRWKRRAEGSRRRSGTKKLLPWCVDSDGPFETLSSASSVPEASSKPFNTAAPQRSRCAVAALARIKKRPRLRLTAAATSAATSKFLRARRLGRPLSAP